MKFLNKRDSMIEASKFFCMFYLHCFLLQVAFASSCFIFCKYFLRVFLQADLFSLSFLGKLSFHQKFISQRDHFIRGSFGRTIISSEGHLAKLSFHPKFISSKCLFRRKRDHFIQTSFHPKVVSSRQPAREVLR